MGWFAGPALLLYPSCVKSPLHRLQFANLLVLYRLRISLNGIQEHPKNRGWRMRNLLNRLQGAGIAIESLGVLWSTKTYLKPGKVSENILHCQVSPSIPGLLGCWHIYTSHFAQVAYPLNNLAIRVTIWNSDK